MLGFEIVARCSERGYIVQSTRDKIFYFFLVRLRPAHEKLY